MAHRARRPRRPLADSFVVPGPSGVALRTRLKHLTDQDEKVLRVVGGHLGSLASGDLAARCRDGVDHDKERWARRKRELTVQSSSRWAGSITRATHDQWALARRGQATHLVSLEAGVRTLAEQLAQPLGAKGARGAPGGYRSRREWFGKARRLAVLEDRLTRVREDHQAGVVHVVRGGRKLVNSRHHLDEAGLTEAGWRREWEARRWFLHAEQGLAVIAVDPAYTSKWGAQHWAKPLNSSKRTMTRHGAAAVAIGRRALGHPVRRRTAPPPTHQSDGYGPRTVQTDHGGPGREETRRPATERAHDARRRAGETRTRATSASNTVRDAPSDRRWVQDPLLHTG